MGKIMASGAYCGDAADWAYSLLVPVCTCGGRELNQGGEISTLCINSYLFNFSLSFCTSPILSSFRIGGEERSGARERFDSSGRVCSSQEAPLQSRHPRQPQERQGTAITLSSMLGRVLSFFLSRQNWSFSMVLLIRLDGLVYALSAANHEITSTFFGGKPACHQVTTLEDKLKSLHEALLDPSTSQAPVRQRLRCERRASVTSSGLS